MGKSVSAAVTDLSRACKSTFTLTFAIEILGIDVWHDCNEGWIDLGPYFQGMKLQYQLYSGQIFDIDILIWPHVAKIWCGLQYGWVRTWQFLERRWLTFSIRHVFPVRVMDFRSMIVTVTPTVGVAALSNIAKNDKNLEVFLPPLQFGERRYFARIVETEESLIKFVGNLIWNNVIQYIPPSYLDGLFDVPHPVTDIRHQDAVLFQVKTIILNKNLKEESELLLNEEVKSSRRESMKVTKDKDKEKDKKKTPEKQLNKFEIKLTGDCILCGVGRVIPFETVGDRPNDLGDIVVLISSSNLPAQDDLPLIFVNIENLFDIPSTEFKRFGITQLYTRWKLGEEEHILEPQPLTLKNEIKFNDHHALLLQYDLAAKIAACFLDIHFEIELRGKRFSVEDKSPVLFGYKKDDHIFSTSVPSAHTNEDLDFPIAITKIDARSLAKGINTFIRGEYPLYPLRVTVVNLEREAICTNDFNAIKTALKPNLVVPSHIILEAQMNLEVSLGLVGCRPQKLSTSFSRLYCLIYDTESIMAILKQITDINEEVANSSNKNDLLTGFALDTGETVVLYLEGPRDGRILQVWEMTEDYHPRVRPVFSSSSRYATRIYPELTAAVTPFIIMKMYVSLGSLLACPTVYARPALPLPARSALLKIGRLIADKLHVAPIRCEMPSAAELTSFKLELCSPPRPINTANRYGYV